MQQCTLLMLQTCIKLAWLESGDKNTEECSQEHCSVKGNLKVRILFIIPLFKH